MTTAHRPTWKAAVGRSQEGGYSTISTQRSVLDEAAHTKLKVRKGPQLVSDRSRDEIVRASLEKLERAEEKLRQLKGVGVARREIVPEIEERGRQRLLKQTAEVDDEAMRSKYADVDADADADEGGDGDGGGGGGGGWSDLDASDGESDLDASDSDEEGDESDDESDEDEEAALQAELARIRAEREAEKAKARAEEEAEERARMEEAALVGNPLLNAADGGVGGGGGARLKRRWNDDVVFRNQARGEVDPSAKKRFINDTVRNDFHKRFLNKFIR